MLASSPDGRGALCTDDEARLTLRHNDQTVASWSHRFWSADQRGIACLPPQRLTVPAAPGTYQVQIELEDRFPPLSSSRAYYLVAVTASPRQTPTSDHTFHAPPARASDKPGESSAQERSSHVAASPPPTQTILPGPPLTAEPIRSVAVPPPTANRLRAAWMLLGGTVVALVGLPYVLWRRSRQPAARQARLHGMVYVYDLETREARTIFFDGTTPILIQRHPLALVPYIAPPPQDVIGRIEPEYPAPRLVDAAENAYALPLDHDHARTIANGMVTVRFRAASAPPPDRRYI